MALGAYTQENRPMTVHTPLGENALLLHGFLGHEGISELFSYQVDVVAVEDVAFDKLLGQEVTVDVTLPDDEKRYFSGICVRVTQGGRDQTFIAHRLEIVPKLWLLTRQAQSRIFQNMSVPDILKKVLTGLEVDYQIQGTFHPRTFCVQYRETDFNFVSRLMEEEGIFYLFKHTADGHKMVVANTSQSHPDVPDSSKIIYEEVEGGTREEDRIHRWEKLQELRSGKYTLWDHAFELPHKNLEATTTILDSVSVGKVTHKLKVGGNDRLELYDYPGEYARRFEGGESPEQIQKVFQDNKRTVDLRIQQEETASIAIHGESTCRQFVAGHKFTVERHFNADGAYVLTGVQHAATQGGYRTGDDVRFSYSNTFTCIPLALPYRPPLKTPRPLVQGTQTAVVVGPLGEKIYTDKYARVKVQFHWDRDGKQDDNSSCWIRVSQPWGGGNWGGMFIPHVGQEVIVSFIEGDPDRPLITGRVYNPEMMPPLELPGNKTKSAIRDHGGNEIIMEGDAGKQQMRFYSPTHNTSITLGRNSGETSTDTDWYTNVGRNQFRSVGGDVKSNVHGNVWDVFLGFFIRFIGGMVNTVIGGIKTETIYGAEIKTIRGAQTTTIFGRKAELIRGNTYKIHIGEAAEWKKSRGTEKTPSRHQDYKELKAVYGVARNKVNGDYNMKVGANLQNRGNKIINKAKADNVIQAGATMVTRGNKLVQKGSTFLAKVPDMKWDTGKANFKGGTLVIK